MASIYDILDGGEWPFTSRPASIPEGILTDVHISGAFTGATLTDLAIGDGVLIGMVLSWSGGSLPVSVESRSARRDTAYPIKDGEGNIWGRVVMGDVGVLVNITGVSVALDPRCVLTYSGDTLSPDNVPTETEYTFSGDSGVVIALDPTTNVVHFDIDEGLYTAVDRTENLDLQSALDTGIRNVGNITGDNISIYIEGTCPVVVETDRYILVTYVPLGEDVWTGCGDDTTFQKTIRCSSKDGSETPYPLDDLFCETEEGRCPYPWEAGE